MPDKHTQNHNDQSASADASGTSADWYVPSVTAANFRNLPAGLTLTVFNPLNHSDQGLSPERLQREYEISTRAIGESLVNFSPERLALHETIIGISTQIKTRGEDNFVQVCDEIYKNNVLPVVAARKAEFAQRETAIKENARACTNQYLEQGSIDVTSPLAGRIAEVAQKFDKNFEAFNHELNELRTASQTRRMDRVQRDRIADLSEVVGFMRENKAAIIADHVAASEMLQTNQHELQSIISGIPGDVTHPGLLASGELATQYDHLTQLPATERKGFLIVGGAASGKGGVTNLVKNGMADPHDVVEVNPDLYKRILMPFDDVGEHTELHGSLTHNESSLVTDGIAERWQAMAESGSAPNVLMDVQRAGSWMRDVLSTGGTHIEIHSPLVPIEVALERSYARGERVGRFVPTAELIQGHKDQVATNLDAFKSGADFTFYNTNGTSSNNPQGLPIVARFNGEARRLDVYDPPALMDYFTKADLNPHAKNANEISNAHATSTAKTILEYGRVATIAFHNPDGSIYAQTINENGVVHFQISDMTAFERAMGEKQSNYLLEGMVRNNIDVRGDEHVATKVHQIAEEINSSAAQTRGAKPDYLVRSGDPATEEYAHYLRELVDHGRRYEKTAPIEVLDVKANEGISSKPFEITLVNPDDPSKATTYKYDPSDAKAVGGKRPMIVIDPKIHPTPESRAAIVKQIQETGAYSGEGVWINVANKIESDYKFAETADSKGFITATPDPEKVRIAVHVDKPVKIPVQWGEYQIESAGSLVVRESDFPAIKEALAQYEKTGDKNALLQPDGKAKFDVYGTDPYFVQDNYSPVAIDGTEYRSLLQRIRAEGRPLAKIGVGNDAVAAYQLKPGESYALPTAGGGVKTVEAGDWITIKANDIPTITKTLETDAPLFMPSGPVHEIGTLDNPTVEKSYRVVASTMPDINNSLNFNGYSENIGAPQKRSFMPHDIIITPADLVQDIPFSEHSFEYQQLMAFRDPGQYLNQARHAVQQAVFQENPELLQFASPEVQQEIVNRDSKALKYASKELQLQKLQSPENIKYNLQYASHEIQSEMVSKDPAATLRFASDAVQLEQLSKDGLLLKHFRFSNGANPEEFAMTREMVEVAYKNNPEALQYARYDIQSDMLGNDHAVIRYVDPQTRAQFIRLQPEWYAHDIIDGKSVYNPSGGTIIDAVNHAKAVNAAFPDQGPVYIDPHSTGVVIAVTSDANPEALIKQYLADLQNKPQLKNDISKEMLTTESGAKPTSITQEQALTYGREHAGSLTEAYTAGKRMYIGVNITDLPAGEKFSYLNPKDAPKAVLGSDGVTHITILKGAPLETVKEGLAGLGHTFEVLPGGEWDNTVQVAVKGLSDAQAQGLIRDIHYTSQTVSNAGPEGMVNVIQAAVNDAQAKEVLDWWKAQGRTQADYKNLVQKVADIQVRDGAKIGDVYDDKAAKIGQTRLVSGNDVAETPGFAQDGYYVRNQTKVLIAAGEHYVLAGADSKGDQYVDGKGILIYELDKEGNITGVRSSAEDHATSNGNFLDANGKAITSLDNVHPAKVAAVTGSTLGNGESIVTIPSATTENSSAKTTHITQEQALKYGQKHVGSLTEAYTAGKRLYIGVNITDLPAGEKFSYLNPKDAPKAVLGADGVTRITILDGAPLETVKQGLAGLGHEFTLLPKGEYDNTVQIEVKGLSNEQAQGLIRDIHYTSQTVTNAGPDGMVNVIQAAVNDAQSKEVLDWWKEQGRTQADYKNLVQKVADIQVRDGAKIGDVYDDKAAKIGKTRLVTGNEVSENPGFATDGYYVRNQTKVLIASGENYVLAGADSKGDQYVDGKGILIYELDKEGKITGVRSSAEDHATSNGNFLDANGKAITSLDNVHPATVAASGNSSTNTTAYNYEPTPRVPLSVQLQLENNILASLEKSGLVGEHAPTDALDWFHNKLQTAIKDNTPINKEDLLKAQQQMHEIATQRLTNAQGHSADVQIKALNECTALRQAASQTGELSNICHPLEITHQTETTRTYSETEKTNLLRMANDLKLGKLTENSIVAHDYGAYIEDCVNNGLAIDPARMKTANIEMNKINALRVADNKIAVELNTKGVTFDGHITGQTNLGDAIATNESRISALSKTQDAITAHVTAQPSSQQNMVYYEEVDPGHTTIPGGAGRGGIARKPGHGNGHEGSNPAKHDPRYGQPSEAMLARKASQSGTGNEHTNAGKTTVNGGTVDVTKQLANGHIVPEPIFDPLHLNQFTQPAEGIAPLSGFSPVTMEHVATNGGLGGTINGGTVVTPELTTEAATHVPPAPPHIEVQSAAPGMSGRSEGIGALAPKPSSNVEGQMGVGFGLAMGLEGVNNINKIPDANGWDKAGAGAFLGYAGLGMAGVHVDQMVTEAVVPSLERSLPKMVPGVSKAIPSVVNVALAVPSAIGAIERKDWGGLGGITGGTGAMVVSSSITAAATAQGTFPEFPGAAFLAGYFSAEVGNAVGHDVGNLFSGDAQVRTQGEHGLINKANNYLVGPGSGVRLTGAATSSVGRLFEGVGGLVTDWSKVGLLSEEQWTIHNSSLLQRGTPDDIKYNAYKRQQALIDEGSPEVGDMTSIGSQGEAFIKNYETKRLPARQKAYAEYVKHYQEEWIKNNGAVYNPIGHAIGSGTSLVGNKIDQGGQKIEEWGGTKDLFKDQAAPVSVAGAHAPVPAAPPPPQGVPFHPAAVTHTGANSTTAQRAEHTRMEKDINNLPNLQMQYIDDELKALLPELEKQGLTKTLGVKGHLTLAEVKAAFPQGFDFVSFNFAHQGHLTSHDITDVLNAAPLVQQRAHQKDEKQTGGRH